VSCSCDHIVKKEVSRFYAVTGRVKVITSTITIGAAAIPNFFIRTGCRPVLRVPLLFSLARASCRD
jgi:hypothetical protein